MTSKEILHDGKFLRVVREGTWEYVERISGKHVAYIVPVSENKWGEAELIFIEEYRIPLKNWVVGFPAGLVGDVGDEDVITAAHRELEEETGYIAKRMRHLISGPPSSGLSDETVHIYLADRLVQIGEGGGDDSENIRICKVPFHKAENWLYDKEKNDGYAIDIKAYIGLYYANKMNLE